MQRGFRRQLSDDSIAMHFDFELEVQLLALPARFAEPHNQCVKGIGADFAC